MYNSAHSRNEAFEYLKDRLSPQLLSDLQASIPRLPEIAFDGLVRAGGAYGTSTGDFPFDSKRFQPRVISKLGPGVNLTELVTAMRTDEIFNLLVGVNIDSGPSMRYLSGIATIVKIAQDEIRKPNIGEHRLRANQNGRSYSELEALNRRRISAEDEISYDQIMRFAVAKNILEQAFVSQDEQR
ncbi:MAG TPA: hypothetical protein VJJ52_01950 [Candidatus Nanoarchaeia archaeon]|nr:hypothetical protein [Candidatus Nanoarchaeia archaeon]